MDNFEELLMKRLESMDQKLDEVRTVTLPAIKTDVALISERDRVHNKIFSGVSSLVAVIASVFLSNVKR